MLMKMLSKRVVGWMDDTEWEAVYCNLYFGSELQIRTALDVISVWRARYSDRIPVGIEATAQLFECRLLEGDEHCMVKRQTMSAAISQFVGLLTERKLKGRLYATPMHVRGEELGIPEWVTSLRHDAAHGFMPSYFMLEKGIDFAINWLHVNHWQKHLERQREKRLDEEREDADEVNFQSPAESVKEPIDDKLIELVRDYLAHTSDRGFTKKSVFGLIKGYTREKNLSPESLPTVLIMHNFIPIKVEDEGHGSRFYVGSKGKQQLSPWAKSTFSKIFALLQKLDGLHLLLLKLCAELEYSFTSVQLCSIWVEYLLTFFDKNSCPDLMWTEVIDRLKNGKASSQVVLKVADIARTFDNKRDPSNGEISDQVEQLAEGAKSCEMEARDKYLGLEDDVPSWTLCDQIAEGCPFGLMPGQNRMSLWKGLYHHKLEDMKAEDFGPIFVETTSPQNIMQSHKPIFSGAQVMQFCNDIDLL